jgi:hypothetical protein
MTGTAVSLPLALYRAMPRQMTFLMLRLISNFG